MVSRERLLETLKSRIHSAGPSAERCLSEATEIVVFGSMATGLDRPDSDLDVLCIGPVSLKVKTKNLDLIALQAEATKGPWIRSELASHVASYGVWLQGCPSWRAEAHTGLRAVAQKRHRVMRYLAHLNSVWFSLDECFRTKYSIKLRRETERLLLLERTIPVPPTRILDELWNQVSISENDVQSTIQRLSRAPSSPFLHDLLKRISAHFSVRTSHSRETTDPSSRIRTAGISIPSNASPNEQGR
jgi:predicted nucleotidyltransferase